MRPVLRFSTLLTLAAVLFTSILFFSPMTTAEATVRIAGMRTTPDQKYVILYNPASHVYTADDLALYYYPGSRSNLDNPVVLAEFSGTIQPQSYLMVAQATWQPPAGTTVDAVFSASALAINGGALQLATVDAELDLLCWGNSSLCGDDSYAALPTGYAYQHCLDETGQPQSCKTDGLYSDYYEQTNNPVLSGGGFLPLPTNECEGLKVSEIGANLSNDQQFVEVQNILDRPLDLTGCQLMTNRSDTRSYVFPEKILSARSYQVVLIENTELLLTKSTDGVVYALSAGGDEVDSQQYSSLRPDTSWARFDNNIWHQTYRLTPNGANIFQEFAACPEGQQRNPGTGRCRKPPQQQTLPDCGSGRYRHPETNRCRNRDAQTSRLKPCRADQQRNPETNRCRLISSGSGLKPCRADQVRNPATNRCRKIDNGSSLKPCKPDQERNPATNRCRKIPESLSALSNLAAVPESKAKPLGFNYKVWGALGMAVAGYGLYEYRNDFRQWLSRIRSKKIKHKPPG